jgi:FolB domain-containing protein
MLIKIKNLNLKTPIGIHDWEKDFQREIIINVEMETGHEISTLSDDISDALDYDIIVAKIKDLIAKNRYNLVEKMAAEVLNIAMLDLRVKRAKVEIDKVGSLENLGSFAVVIEKSR